MCCIISHVEEIKKNMWIEISFFRKLIMLKYILHPMDAFVEIKMCIFS